ncbi:MAG TPA: 4-oxalocrotonate tautomerase DmpI [Methanocella sp.]|nr:4-oxalocrotonate tautomerase DmpI [Methanocella sp.]
MPIITMETGPLSSEQKEKLIQAFTRDACEATGLPPEAMIVLIHELSPDCIGLSGRPLSKIKH